MPTVLGIDPGGRDTAYVVLDNGTLITSGTFTNPGELHPLPRVHVQTVARGLVLVAHEHSVDIVAVEGLNRPNWHMKGSALNPSSLFPTSEIIGALKAVDWPNDAKFVLIDPDKNGSSFLGAYPEQLVSKTERSKPGWQMRIGTGKLRHQRSAYDVARKAR